MKFDTEVCYACFYTHTEAVKNISFQRHANAKGVPMYSLGSKPLESSANKKKVLSARWFVSITAVESFNAVVR